MLTIRAAQCSDIDDLMKLSAETGSGMTTMPVDKASWQRKLDLTEGSFQNLLDDPRESVFVLVLENTDTNSLVGTSAVIASVGSQLPFYSYKLSTQVMVSRELDINTNTQILQLVNDFTGCSELASLFLSEPYRRDSSYRGAGRFLSLARFLLIHDFPDFFSDRIFAELRGFVNEDGESPFWNALGQKFFGLEYTRADLLSAVSGNQFISDLMPKYPIYLDLLSEEAQKVVGKANTASIPAMRLLEKEGFVDTGYVDIFDAGPTLECRSKQIKTLSAAKIGSVLNGLKDSESNQMFMVSNRNPHNYRVLLVEGYASSSTLSLSTESLEALQLESSNQASWTLFGEIKR